MEKRSKTTKKVFAVKLSSYSMYRPIKNVVLLWRERSLIGLLHTDTLP